MKVDLGRLAGLDVHAKAEFLGEAYARILFDPCGIARCMQHVDGDGIRPFKPEDFEAGDVLEGPAP